MEYKPTPSADHLSIQVREVMILPTRTLTFQPTVVLPEYCWAAICDNLLDKISGHHFSDTRLFIWEVLPAKHFMWIRQGSYPYVVELHTSLDPYCFLITQEYN